jgi:hypothetical protein
MLRLRRATGVSGTAISRSSTRKAVFSTSSRVTTSRRPSPTPWDEAGGSGLLIAISLALLVIALVLPSAASADCYSCGAVKLKLSCAKGSADSWNLPIVCGRRAIDRAAPTLVASFEDGSPGCYPGGCTYDAYTYRKTTTTCKHHSGKNGVICIAEVEDRGTDPSSGQPFCHVLHLEPFARLLNPGSGKVRVSMFYSGEHSYPPPSC